MKKLLTISAFALLSWLGIFASANAAPLSVNGGGTGALTLTGCLTGNGTGPITGTGVACPTGGGGGSGGGTWATTTSAVPAWLINYPLNTTDIVCIGGTATSTCKFIFDPNSQIGYFSSLLGINTKSPTYPLDVVGLGHFTGLVDAATFTATSSSGKSIFPNASTTALTVSGIGGLYIGTLTGPLQAVAGVVTASSTLSTFFGGTGLNSTGASSTVITTDGIVNKYNKLSTGNFTTANISQWTNDSGYLSGNPLLDSLSLNGGSFIIDTTNQYGAAGTVLMSRGTAAGDVWVATTTFSSPLSYSAGAVSCPTCNTSSASVTSVATNAGLTGGTITTSGTIGLDLTKLPVNNLILTYNGSQLQATGTDSLTVPRLIATTTASSTFAGGVDVARVCITGTTTCLGAAGGGSGTVTSVATNNGLTGGTITNTGTIGLIISGLTTNTIVGWNGSQLQATGTDSLTVPKLFATTTATSTFVGPLATASASTTATSTMAGINLPYGGCVAVLGVCLTSNAGTVTSVATNNGLTGGTITGAGTLGLDTTGLSTNGLLTWNGSKLFATGTTGTLTVPALISTSTTATSTFAAGLQATYINLTGGTSATNTAASGFNLTAGCYAIANVCIGGGSGSGTVTSVATNNGLTGGTITTSGTLGLDLTKLVSGALTFWNGSQLQATGTQQLTVGNLLATTSTATSTFMGGIVGPNNFTVQQTSGWVGIASATPMTGFAVGAATSTFSGDLKVGAKVGSTTLASDYQGHMFTGGAQPTCGTGCSTVVGDDNSMRVVTGTTISSATVNFASTWKNSAGVAITPVCVASEESAGTVTADASSTPTTVVLEFASALTSTRIAVQCQASDNFSF